MEKDLTPEEVILEGHVSIEAALEADSREIRAIYVREGKSIHDLPRLSNLARNAGVPVHSAGSDFIDDHSGGKSHGGVIAVGGPRRTVSLQNLIPRHAAPFVAMIDGVEDPFNFAAAVRSLYLAGAHGLVVRPRSWISAAGVLGRASAGASEKMPTAVAPTLAYAASVFSSLGLAVACAAATPESISVYQADLTVPLFLVIGGEQRGITRSFLRQADMRLRIPYARNEARALGTAAAAAVIGFEIMRQRTSGLSCPDASRA